MSYNITLCFFIKNKSKYVISNKFLNHKTNIKFLKSTILKSEKALNNLNNPYGFTIRRYIILKYVFSPITFLVIYIRTQNILVSIFYGLIFFFIPNFFIYSFKKNESLKLINEISKVTNNLILALSSNIPLHTSLKIASNSVNYSRFKKEFEIFMNDYIMYNFNMIRAVDNIKHKFNSCEFNMFLNILIQGEKEGKIIQNLDVFSQTLDLSYFKYLKYKESKRMMFVVLSCIISLINITVIAVYPMMIQIAENLQTIFN